MFASNVNFHPLSFPFVSLMAEKKGEQKRLQLEFALKLFQSICTLFLLRGYPMMDALQILVL